MSAPGPQQHRGAASSLEGLGRRAEVGGGSEERCDKRQWKEGERNVMPRETQ